MEEDASPTDINWDHPSNLDNLVTLVADSVRRLDLYLECNRGIFKSVVNCEK